MESDKKMGMTRGEAGKLGRQIADSKLKEKWEKFRQDYDKNPIYCKTCNIAIDYLKRFNKFCSKSCSAKFNNSLREKKLPRTRTKRIKKNYALQSKICGWCEQDFKTTDDCNCCSKRCAGKLLNQRKWQIIKENIEHGENTNAKYCKRYLIEQFGEKCQQCAWAERNLKSGKIPVELNHIDGNSENNIISNVNLLCPNCHSLTPTYRALNKGNGRFVRMVKYKIGKSY
jgi:hypothetical protein